MRRKKNCHYNVLPAAIEVSQMKMEMTASPKERNSAFTKNIENWWGSAADMRSMKNFSGYSDKCKNAKIWKKLQKCRKFKKV